jgi:hypothetical protein
LVDFLKKGQARKIGIEAEKSDFFFLNPINCLLGMGASMYFFIGFFMVVRENFMGIEAKTQSA